ncbi:MAG: glycosyltransferase family 4 protein, partial [Gammaproteobacteria bacterium]|nr:glycosyltransferase family 4 protein [Gammaproteobacteria bacterium]
MARRLTVVQMLPALESGGVEKGTLEVGKYLVDNGHRSMVISAGGRMVAQLEREGSEHVAWPVGAKRFSTLGYISKVRELLAREKPDILHLRSRLPAWIGYRAWKGLPAATRPHLVTTVHGPYTPGWYSSVMVRGERVIAISQMIHQYILKNYPWVDPKIIRDIPRGVSPIAYPHGYTPSAEWLAAWRAQYPELAGKYVITLPARLTRWKGQEDLIKAIAGLKRRGLPAHGVLVGDAHPKKQYYANELRAQVHAAGLEGHFTFTGHRGDVKEIMAVSDVVLSLSLDPEAFGRVSLEALTLGKPVAAYDHGGVAEQLAAVFPEGRVSVGDVAVLEE